MTTRTLQSFRASLVASTAVALAAVGCMGGDPQPSAGASASEGAPDLHAVAVDTTVKAAGPGKVFATVAMSNGHTLTFGQTASGSLVLGESGLRGDDPLFDKTITARPVAEVYRLVTGGLVAPDALVAAEQAAAHRAIEKVAPPPASAKSAPREDFVIYQHDWFYDTFCSGSGATNLQVCDDAATGPINANQAQYTWGANFSAVGYVYPQDTQDGALLEYDWNGSGWVFDWISPSIAPNSWYSVATWDSSPVYRSAELAITGEGGLTMYDIMASGLQVTYDDANSVFNFSMGGASFGSQWPNDPDVKCYVSDGTHKVYIASVSTSSLVKGINAAIGGACPFQGEAGPSTGDTAWCVGSKTGQNPGSVYVQGNTWNYNGGYCCASKGGSNTHC